MNWITISNGKTINSTKKDNNQVFAIFPTRGMKCLVVLLTVLTAIYAKDLARLVPEENTAYGYLANIGIPEAERLRKAEEEYLVESYAKIIGGQPSQLGLIPYQVSFTVPTNLSFFIVE